MQRLLTAREVAQRLGVGLSTVYEIAGEPGCPVYRIGSGRGTLRFDLDELLEWLRQRSRERQGWRLADLPPLYPRLPSNATQRRVAR